MNLSSVLRCPYCHKEDLGNIDLVIGIHPYVEQFFAVVVVACGIGSTSQRDMSVKGLHSTGRWRND